MEHSKRCELATRPTCVCSTCGDSDHAWSGDLARAREGDSGISELREPAERIWWEPRRRFQENGRRAPTKYLRQAGGGVAVASVVAWLASDKQAVEQVHRLGRLLKEDVFDRELREFARELAGKDPAFAEYGRALVGHFWCDLLVEIARTLDRGADLVGRVPGEVADAVLEHDDVATWGPVRRRLAQEALVFLWKGVQMLLGADLRALVLQVRVLAILICPGPRRPSTCRAWLPEADAGRSPA